MVLLSLFVIVSEYLFTKRAARQREALKIPDMTRTIENLALEGIAAPGLDAASLRLPMRSTVSVRPDESECEPGIILVSPLELPLQVESAELD